MPELFENAPVAELVDAPDSKSGGLWAVCVRVRPGAPFSECKKKAPDGAFLITIYNSLPNSGIRKANKPGLFIFNIIVPSGALPTSAVKPTGLVESIFRLFKILHIKIGHA